MFKHFIYIHNDTQEDLLSVQLAHAFARFRYENGVSSYIVQYGSHLSPLKIAQDSDTLQIIFTPVRDLKGPLHEQTDISTLLHEVPALISHLKNDGFHANGCRIQLYTLEQKGPQETILQTVAQLLTQALPDISFSLELHVIPKLKNLQEDELGRIFNTKMTYRDTVHVIREAHQTKMIASNTRNLLELQSDAYPQYLN